MKHSDEVKEQVAHEVIEKDRTIASAAFLTILWRPRQWVSWIVKPKKRRRGVDASCGGAVRSVMHQAGLVAAD